MTKLVSSDPDKMYSPVSFQDMVLTYLQSEKQISVELTQRPLRITALDVFSNNISGFDSSKWRQCATADHL